MKLLKDILLTVVSRFSIVVSALLISVITARFLGPEGRGQYFYVITLSTLLAQFSMLGLQTSNTYLVAQNSLLLSKLTMNSVWIAIIVCIPCSLITAIFLTKSSSGTDGYLFFVIFLAPLYLFYLLSTSLQAGVGKIRELNSYQIIYNFLTIVAVLCAGYFSRSIYLTLGFITIAWILTAYLLFNSLMSFNKGAGKFSFDIFKEGFSYSFRAYIVYMCALLVLRTNILLLQHLCPEKVVGFYSVSAQVIDAISLIPTTVALLLLPHLIKSDGDLFAITMKTIKMLGSLMLLIILILWWLAPALIKFLFGENFSSSVEILRYMLPGGFFYALIMVLSQMLAAKGLPKSFTLLWISAAILNLISSYIFIKKYFVIGAALSFSLSYAGIFIFSFIICHLNKAKSFSSIAI